MKRLFFLPSDQLPEDHQQDTDYVVAWNDHRIAIGDRLDFADIDGAPVTVMRLWLVIGRKFVEDAAMEIGHNYIVRFDRPIGRVEFDVPYNFEKI